MLELIGAGQNAFALLSTTSLNFGSRPENTSSLSLPVTITNTGKTVLDILGITLTGTNPSSFEQLDNCGATLAASASCSVYVAFTPHAVGAVTAKLSVTDNGSTTTQTVALSGTGN